MCYVSPTLRIEAKAMKWFLWVYLVTTNGVTESLSDFETLQQCKEAEQIIHHQWQESDDLVILNTGCRYE